MLFRSCNQSSSLLGTGESQTDCIQVSHLEYASCAWEPSANKEIEALKIVQNQGVRMICGLKGRRGVTEAKEKLQLEQLVIRRKNSRVKLLHKIMSREEAHPALCSSYDEIINQFSDPHNMCFENLRTIYRKYY